MHVVPCKNVDKCVFTTHVLLSNIEQPFCHNLFSGTMGTHANGFISDDNPYYFAQTATSARLASSSVTQREGKLANHRLLTNFCLLLTDCLVELVLCNNENSFGLRREFYNNLLPFVSADWG